MCVAEERKRSHLQTDLYEVNGKRILVQRIPGISDFWADATPAQSVIMIIVIVVIILVGSVMNYFDLLFGGVASESQLKSSLSQKSEQTGPNLNYGLEAQHIIQNEAVKRDSRVKEIGNVNIETTPERYQSNYRGITDRRVGYIGQGQYQVFFWYIIRENHKSTMVYGYGLTRINQSSVALLPMVKQIWSVVDFRITNTNII